MTALCCFVAFVLLAQPQDPPGAGAVVALSDVNLDTVPLTVWYEEWLTSPGRAPLQGARLTLAVRRDRSTAKERVVYSLDGAKVASHIREIGFGNGDRIRTDEILRLVTALRTAFVFSEDLPVVTARSNCSLDFTGRRVFSYADEGTKFLGYRVVVERRQAGLRRMTSWRSPELGCVELRRLAEFLDSDGRVTDASELKAVRVAVGDPVEGLFSVPLDYEHVSFSEAFRRSAKAMGRTVDDAEILRFRSMDEAWRRRRIPDLATAGNAERPSTRKPVPVPH